MLPRLSQAPIVAAERPSGEVAGLLWQRLLAEPWPLPPDALPPGTALVGGAVRDGLLGRLGPQPDLDFVVVGDAIPLARQLARSHGGSAVVLDAERSIARLVVRGWNLDLARREGASLEADLGRRDFTINAIALLLPGTPGGQTTLVDPTGGLAHLERRQLVAVSEANLLADPLRLLRGLRLAWGLDFELEPTSLGWIRRHAPLLAGVAGERVLAELEKLAAAPAGERGLGQVLGCGLLQPWGVEPDRAAAVGELALERARQWGLQPEEIAWALPLARLCALLPPEALAALRSSRRLQQRCRALRHWRLQLAQAKGWAGLPEASRVSLHRELEADLPALLLLLPDPSPDLLARWRQADDPLLHPRPPLDGRSLQQQLGIPAGPALGHLLDHLTLERAFGRLGQGGAEGSAALRAAERWWLQHNPSTGMEGRRD